jgi:predicted TIM-barrel fold metal-dependent hydrolase
VPDCCVDLMGYVNPALVEFPYDTGRAMLSLLFGGAFRRFPRIRWIFSHGGGTIPMLSGRIASIARFQKNAAEFAPEGTDREFLKHHYEIANATSRPAMAALRAYLPADRIMFGTDFPFVPVRQTVAGLAEAEMTAAERTAIERGNALQLLPQLGQA